MKTEEMIKALKEKGYEIKKLERFLKVKFSDKDDVLLRDENGNVLIRTWDNKRDLNDFENFKKADIGQFWIRGNMRKFEFLYNGEWLEIGRAHV